MTAEKLITYAPDAWKLLSGYFCVYKPSGFSAFHIRTVVADKLCADLNSMHCRPQIEHVKIEGSISEKKLVVTSVPSVADHPLLTGPRYQPQDLKINWVTHLGKLTSGVFVMTVNTSRAKRLKFEEARHVRTYEIKGEFGIATDTLFHDGKIMEKATYKHITFAKLGRLLASIQASHQVKAYKFAGVPLASQEAYEMACSGLVRPSGNSLPLIYSIKCIHFEPPSFALEVNCVNENEDYLLSLITEIGLELKSCAVCSQLRQVRYGYFNLDHALLRKHWALENILNNIQQCKGLVTHEMIDPKGPTLQKIPLKALMPHSEAVDYDVQEDEEAL